MKEKPSFRRRHKMFKTVPTLEARPHIERRNLGIRTPPPSFWHSEHSERGEPSDSPHASLICQPQNSHSRRTSLLLYLLCPLTKPLTHRKQAHALCREAAPLHAARAGLQPQEAELHKQTLQLLVIPSVQAPKTPVGLD